LERILAEIVVLYDDVVTFLLAEFHGINITIALLGLDFALIVELLVDAGCRSLDVWIIAGFAST